MELAFRKKPILLGTSGLWCCTILKTLGKKEVC
jgi:hypothetical protein